MRRRRRAARGPPRRAAEHGEQVAVRGAGDALDERAQLGLEVAAPWRRWPASTSSAPAIRSRVGGEQLRARDQLVGEREHDLLARAGQAAPGRRGPPRRARRRTRRAGPRADRRRAGSCASARERCPAAATGSPRRSAASPAARSAAPSPASATASSRASPSADAFVPTPAYGSRELGGVELHRPPHVRQPAGATARPAPGGAGTTAGRRSPCASRARAPRPRCRASGCRRGSGRACAARAGRRSRSARPPRTANHQSVYGTPSGIGAASGAPEQHRGRRGVVALQHRRPGSGPAAARRPPGTTRAARVPAASITVMSP